MKQVYYKQNEKFEYEFFNDKECKEAFKFEKSEVLYVELKNGDISPLMHIYYLGKNLQNLFIPYLPFNVKTSDFLFQAQSKENFTMHTFLTIESLDFYNFCKLQNSLNVVSHITPNYSKYIPNDCAVVFLNKWEYVDNFQKYNNILKECPIYIKNNSNPELCENKDCACQGGWDIYPMHNTTSSQLPKKVILFTPELTSTNIKQINDTAKVLKEKYGIEWVGVFAELCFLKQNDLGLGNAKYHYILGSNYISYFDKLITTNATGLLEPQESEHLQVIDCKEIFEEFFETNE